jgi:hypothetical protein
MQFMKLRSPEEMAEDWVNILLDRTKVDVYMMGNVMYYVLTTHWLFEGDTWYEAVDKIFHQERSHIPPKLLASEDPAIQAILWAIKACWSQDPDQRPPARHVSDFLKKKLMRIENVDELGIVRVASMPPLPVGFRHTDSDFDENLDRKHHYYDDDQGIDDDYDEGHSNDNENVALHGDNVSIPDTQAFYYYYRGVV